MDNLSKVTQPVPGGAAFELGIPGSIVLVLSLHTILPP